MFVKAGVKLRQTSFDMWMDFAAKIGLFSVFLHCIYSYTWLSSCMLGLHLVSLFKVFSYDLKLILKISVIKI